MKKIIILILPIFVIFLVGCQLTDQLQITKNTPFFREVKANPAYIIPSHNQEGNQVNIITTIDNPTKLKLTGKMEMRFNEKCFEMFPKEKDVTVKNEDSFSASLTISTKYYSSLPDDCYRPQKILIILESDDKSVIYDSKEVEVTIAKS